MTLLISKDGRVIEKLEKLPVEKEDFLQQYVKDNRGPLLSAIKNDIKFLAFREFPTKVTGGIDVLAIDQDGEIYLIEAKLNKNHDKRDIIGQIFDYCDALENEYDGNEFVKTILNEINKQVDKSIDDIRGITSSLQMPDTKIVKNLKQNQKNGNFKLIIVMDQIENRLKRILNTINQKSIFSILAVEIEHYMRDGHEIVVPRWFGLDITKSNSRADSTKYEWNEEGFFDQLRRNVKSKEVTDSQSSIIMRLYEFVKSYATNGEGQLLWGTGKKASFILIHQAFSETRMLFKMDSFGMIQIAVANVPEPYQSFYLQELRKIEGLENDFKIEQGNYYIPIERFGPQVDEFIQTIKSLTSSRPIKENRNP